MHLALDVRIAALNCVRNPEAASVAHYFTEKNSAEAVIARLEGCQDPRFKQVIESAIRHLHAFVKEVEPTTEEWSNAI